VPRVPDGPGPELGGHRLVSRPRGAGVLAEALDLVERVRVSRAGQRRLRLRPKLLRVVEDEGFDVRPAGEDRRSEAWRNRPEVAGLVSGNEWLRDGGGAVTRAVGHQFRGH